MSAFEKAVQSKSLDIRNFVKTLYLIFSFQPLDMMDAKENEQSKILWVDVLHIIKMWLTYSYNTYD